MAFTDPGDNVHVGEVPSDTAAYLATDPAQPNTDVLALLVGPNRVAFSFGLDHDGHVTFVTTEAIDRAPIPIGQLATGTYTVASP